MNIFLTGIDGYIGALLGPLLAARGHTVVGLDTGYYREGWLAAEPDQTFPMTRTGDIRHIRTGDLDGIDCVVHLAELSNDPLGENDPAVTFAINHEGSVRLAEMAKEVGVESVCLHFVVQCLRRLRRVMGQ